MPQEPAPALAPATEKFTIDNGPMTVELRSATRGLTRIGGGIIRFDHGGAAEPWKLPYEEILCVLTGTLRIKFADDLLEAGPGEVITVPHGAEVVYEGEPGTTAFYALSPADWYRKKPDSREETR